MIFKKNNIDLPVLTNLVFSFFPASFILGNLIINLNIVIFCCLGIIQLKSQILKNKFNFPLKIIFLLFLLVFLSTGISFIKSLYLVGYEYSNLVLLIKSVTYFRFFLFLIIVYFLSQLDLLNFRYFFISTAFFAIIISLDVIFQHIFGFNTIGMKSMNERHSSGFFGDELIAGGFIKNFSFFTILFFTYVLRNKRNSRFILTTIIICILGVGIIVSGNRMSLVLFLFGLFLIFLFHKNFRIIVSTSFLCLFFLFKFIISTSQPMQWHYDSFFSFSHNESILYNSKDILNSIREIAKKNLKKNYKIEKETRVKREKIEHNHHARLFLTALATWKENKLFGNGIKSFRKDCGRVIMIDMFKYGYSNHYTNTKSAEFIFVCSNHPHNYYLEILTETGIVGFLIIFLIGLFFVIFIFKNFKSLVKINMQNLFLLGITMSLLLEAFPFRSTGSIFTTNNAAYLILIGSILLSYKSVLNEKNFR